MDTVIALVLAAAAGFAGVVAGVALADRLRPVGRTAPA
jgi:hypothetical protein